jgi:hypothetical protein
MASYFCLNVNSFTRLPSFEFLSDYENLQHYFYLEFNTIYFLLLPKI